MRLITYFFLPLFLSCCTKKESVKENYEDSPLSSKEVLMGSTFFNVLLVDTIRLDTIELITGEDIVEQIGGNLYSIAENRATQIEEMNLNIHNKKIIYSFYNQFINESQIIQSRSSCCNCTIFVREKMIDLENPKDLEKILITAIYIGKPCAN